MTGEEIRLQDSHHGVRFALSYERDDEEFNPAPKVDRAPQGTNPNSPGDHWFWR
jgi:hypothetical protein